MITTFYFLAALLVQATVTVSSQRVDNNSKKSSSPALFNRISQLIANDDVSSVDDVIEEDFKRQVNVKNESGWTLLHVAALYGAEKVAEHLLLNGAHVNEALVETGETPMHLASRGGHVGVIKVIVNIAKQLNVNMTALMEARTKADGKTPLFFASNEATISELKKNGADPCQRDAKGDNARYYAQVNNKPELANLLKCNDARDSHVHNDPLMNQIFGEMQFQSNNRLYLTSGQNISAVDEFGQTPACYAAKNGDVRFFKYVNSSGTAVPKEFTEVRCLVFGDHRKAIGSPLHVAVYNRKLDYVKLLIELGADALAQDSTGSTAVHVLAMTSTPTTLKNDEAIVSVLRQKNPKIVELGDRLDRTPFLVAIAATSKDFAEMLRLKFGANPNALDRNRFSAFHLANDAESVDYLLKLPNRVVDLNSRTKLDTSQVTGPGSLTPLHIAVKEKKSHAFVRYLINMIVDKNARNDFGQSAVHVAVESDHVDAIELFASNKGVDFSAQDRDGLTPLLYAIVIGKFATAKKIASLTSIVINSDDRLMTTQENALHLAAKFNSLDLAKTLIETKNARVDAVDVDGRTPLFEAVERQHLKMVEMLLDSVQPTVATQPNPVAVQDKFGKTPLHLASPCTNEAVEIAHMMLSWSLRKFPFNQSSVLQLRDKLFGRTPLESAVAHNCFKLVDLFLTHYNANCSDINKLNGMMTPLHLATYLGHRSLAQSMVETGKCSKSQVDPCGNAVSEQPQIATCGKLPKIANGMIVDENGAMAFPFCVSSKSRLSLKCDDGFVLSGNSSIECDLAEGVWLVGAMCKQRRPMDCEEITATMPNATSGIYEIFLDPCVDDDPKPIRVYCEMKLFGGGWIVMQRRVDGSQDFDLDWANYKRGFGNLETNFWLGNENIHALTQRRYGSRYSMLMTTESTKEMNVSSYTYFQVDGESNDYALNFDRYLCGNVRETLNEVRGMKFTTKDRSDSNKPTIKGRCTEKGQVGWWYRACQNGLYNTDQPVTGVSLTTKKYTKMAMLLRRSPWQCSDQ